MPVLVAVLLLELLTRAKPLDWSGPPADEHSLQIRMIAVCCRGTQLLGRAADEPYTEGETMLESSWMREGRVDGEGRRRWKKLVAVTLCAAGFFGVLPEEY